MGVSTLMGWSRNQWRAAFADQGRELTAALWREACVEGLGGHECGALVTFDEVMADWWTRHAFDPLVSPIVIPDTYRARARS